MSLEYLGVKRIDLDFDSYQLPPMEPVQGDTGTRGFSVRLKDQQGTVIPYTSDIEVRLFGVNEAYPDKTYYTIGEADPSDPNRWLVYLSTDMVSAAGSVSLQAAAYQGGTKLIQSAEREVPVLKSLASGGEIGQDLVVDFTQLTLAIERVEILESNYTASINQQNAIYSDVRARAQYVETVYTETKGVIDAERSRVTAENARITQENARKTAETGRANAESARGTAEGTRKTQETARQQTETARATAETARVDAEKARVSAEGTRVTQEATRQTQEGTRQTNETARQSAESIRQTAETGRVNAESARIQQWSTWEGLIEEGAMPNATSTTAGAVKVDALGTENAPYTAVTTGKLASDMTGKVDKISGKGLSTHDYSDAAKSKVDAIPASPKYTDTITTINGKTGAIAKSDITALGIPAQDTVYTHPSTHPASMITQDSSRRMVSDAQITAWSGKVDSAGGQMTGALVGHANTQYNTAQMRNVVYLPAGTAPPTLPNGTLVLYYE